MRHCGIKRALISVYPKNVTGRIDPNIYGHFVEHVGRVVYGGIWAEMLDNRSFDAADHHGDGPVAPWSLIPAESNRVTTDRTAPRHGRQCVRIDLTKEAPAGVQQGSLGLRRDWEYDFEVWAKASEPGCRLVVGLRTEDGANSYRSIQISDISADWRRYRGKLAPGEDASGAVLSIAASGQGSVYLDAASLMPADNHEGGIRKDVVELVRQMNPLIIRYPGGCFADGYRWKDGIGPRDNRPVSDNASVVSTIRSALVNTDENFRGFSLHELDRLFDKNAWKSFEPNDFGTDESVRFCRTVGAEPLITVNFGSATPEEAADWVAYCNSPSGSAYGALRASNGCPEPYNVKYWGVGNEIWGHHEVGHCSPEEYGRRFVAFAKAMRGVDPNIKLIAVGAMPRMPFENWNAGVLRTKAAKEMDYLSLHQYFGTHPDHPADKDEVARALMAAPVCVGRLLDQTRETIRELVPDGDRIRIIFEEWGTWHGHMKALVANAGIGPYTLADGIFAAGVLHEMQRRSGSVTMANMAQLVNTLGAIRANHTGAFGTSYHAVFKLFTENCLPLAIEVDTDAPTYDSPDAAGVPPLNAVPLIDVAGTRNKEGTKTAISVISRDLSDEIDVSIQISDLNAVEAHVLEMNAGSIHSSNSFETPDEIQISDNDIKVSGDRIEYRLPPHSITTFVFE